MARCPRFVVAVLTALLVPACGQRPGQLPAKAPPAPEGPEISGPEAGYPPAPVNVTDVRTVEWQEIPGALSDALELQLVQSALANPRLSEHLGDRFVYVDAAETFAAKTDESPARPSGYLLVFYSYAHNVAVEATFVETRLESVAARDGYQPPAAREEIERAAKLARSDERLKDEGGALDAFGIVLNPKEGDHHSRYRVLHVTFSGPEDDLPSFYAFVDMTNEEVLEAGPQSALGEEGE